MGWKWFAQQHMKCAGTIALIEGSSSTIGLGVKARFLRKLCRRLEAGWGRTVLVRGDYTKALWTKRNKQTDYKFNLSHPLFVTACCTGESLSSLFLNSVDWWSKAGLGSLLPSVNLPTFYSAVVAQSWSSFPRDSPGHCTWILISTKQERGKTAKHSITSFGRHFLEAVTLSQMPLFSQSSRQACWDLWFLFFVAMCHLNFGDRKKWNARIRNSTLP